MIKTVTQSLTGLMQAEKKAAEASSKIVTINDPESDASLSQSIIDLKTAETEVKANAIVLRTSSDMLGELIDELA
ncbi:hypothetical protein QGN29_13120 [Temperatibacter marinus]|uniref:Flagellar basal-body/hook protein C-terminal domain-containing protein n=1 Tax=Temperatibacter marinus TaxID=1456591 RepID=A0AA52EF37_9PROT|nr:hypothetical protein [Temperatibacter marinus]WND02488.1 hypothetical protein QGN29_13120 [Temperatibacter marinus]